MTLAIESYLDRVRQRFETLAARRVEPNLPPQELAQLGRETTEYEPLVEAFLQWRQCTRNLLHMREMLPLEKDAGMQALVREEAEAEEARMAQLEQDIRRHLVAPDAQDSGSAIMEIRAGAGGDEAAIFAGELLKMYERYALGCGWRFELASRSDEVGVSDGVREALISVSGRGVFGRLKFESGVHRVQRVPRTDSQGRIHTSTVSVAILPEAKDVRIDINEKDLRIDSYKSSGPGGQHVNKTNSAVRVVHLPTGIAVAVQEERCAQQNKQRAMTILRAKLHEIKAAEEAADRKLARQTQIGSSDRSEKIRTYNFPQARVTDHRIGFSIHDLDAFMAGKSLDTLIDQLGAHAEEERLSQLDLQARV